MAYSANEQGKEEQAHADEASKEEMVTNPEQDGSQWSSREDRGRRCEPGRGAADEDAHDQRDQDELPKAPEPLAETDPPAWRYWVLLFRPHGQTFHRKVKPLASQCTLMHQRGSQLIHN